MPRQEEESWSERLLKRKPPLFWWTLANILAFCLALLSWMVCLHVFNNPELPKNYHILKRLGRLPKITEFAALEAPKGTTADPKNLHSKYYNLTDNERALLNQQLIRSYLGNFRETLLNTYLRGDFRVIKTRALSATDFIQKGIVIQAQAYVQPDTYHPPTPYLVVIELILPGAPEGAVEQIIAGDMIEISKNPYFVSVLHTEIIEREGDESIVYLSAIPLVYESPYTPPRGEQFQLSSPPNLNLEVQLPIIPPSF